MLQLERGLNDPCMVWQWYEDVWSAQPLRQTLKLQSKECQKGLTMESTPLLKYDKHLWHHVAMDQYLQIPANTFKYIQIITSIYQTFRCSPGVPGFWKIRMYRKTRYAIPQKCIGHRQNGPWFLATTCHPHWHVRQSPGLKCCKEISVWRSSAWRAPSDGPDVDG